MYERVRPDPKGDGRVRVHDRDDRGDDRSHDGREIIDQKELAERLLAQAKEQGVNLVDPGGLLNRPTKNVLETRSKRS